MQDKHRLQMQATALDALSPLSRLQGGYVYASVSGKALIKTAQVKENDAIKLQLSDGVILTRAESVEESA